MLVNITKLAMSSESVLQVVQDQAAQVAVGVDEGRPSLIAGFLDEIVSQCNCQTCPGFAAGFEVWVKQG